MTIKIQSEKISTLTSKRNPRIGLKLKLDFLVDNQIFNNDF